MIVVKNNILRRENKKPILWDVFYSKKETRKPLVVFCHGYKGFKDWGAWDLVAKAFAKAECCFVKFNFSHNGGTMTQPIDFPDLEAFGQNNYTKELEDLEDMLNLLMANEEINKIIDLKKIILIGHSRGGGIVTVKASEDKRISHLISWAGVSNFENRTVTIGNLEEWKKEGVKYSINGRTKQQMPHYYQFYQDFVENKERLNVEHSVKRLRIPHLIAHGINDPSVLFSEAKDLHSWNPKSELLAIEGCDHVFNTKHPWNKKNLSKELAFLVDRSIGFIKKGSD